MRRPQPRLLLGIGIPLLVVAVLLTAWAIDSSRSSGKVPRNVTLAGRDIGRMPEDELAATVADLAHHYETLDVQVRAPGHSYQVPAKKLGLRLDQQATVQGALDLDHNTRVVARPFTWMGSFVDKRTASLVFTVDNAILASGLADLEQNAKPSEPKLVAANGGLRVVSGSTGKTLDSAGVRDQLLARARSGEEPIVVNAKIKTEQPAVSDQQAQALADRLNLATAPGLTVTAGTHTVTIPADTVRSWLGSKITAGTIEPTLDAGPAQAAVVAAIPVDTKPKNASFTLVNGAVQLTPSADGEQCCGPDTTPRILQALKDGKSTVAVDLVVDKPTLTTEAATKLGIKEPVGSTTQWNGQPQVKSFTTYFPCCASRVTNIHRIADMVQGTLVLPGEKFSMNEVVGQRTAAKGFVPAGAIANGEHVDEIGGGVSQFATTMFNAVYFAGLKIDTYQAHSEYFARYPRGREATMGFPNPDLAWTNNSPYGILVWTSHTPTSVTVTLYSTQWATAEQTGSSDSRSGRCTIVTTQRTIHYPDGRTGTDSFRARYRDKDVTRC